MAWVSLNDVFVNKAGGSISGNLSVDGSLTINSGKGDGSTYNVATQLTNLNNNKAAVSHTHSATDITKGTLSLDHLPTIPVSKGGTGATTASAALTNLGAASAKALKDLQDSVSPTPVIFTSAGVIGVWAYRAGAVIMVEGAGSMSCSEWSEVTLGSGLPAGIMARSGAPVACQSDLVKGAYVHVDSQGRLVLLSKATAITGWTFFSFCYLTEG